MAAAVHTGKHVIWLTGLPSAGKTTIGKRVEELLNGEAAKKKALFFDGDVVRDLLSKDLSHGASDLTKHHERVRAVLVEALEKVAVVVAAFVSPTQAVRLQARAVFEKLGACFHEVYVSASQETVEQRDVKGLYKKAQEDTSVKLPGKNGEPAYEPPEEPALTLDTNEETVEACATSVCSLVTRCG